MGILEVIILTTIVASVIHADLSREKTDDEIEKEFELSGFLPDLDNRK